MILVFALLGCVDAEVADTDAAPADCPDAPTGRELGFLAEDVVATDCEGRPTSLRDGCGRPTLITSWYGWCPSCERNAELGRRLAAEHPELLAVNVLVEDPVGDPMGAEYCAAYVDAWPSDGVVWMDGAKALEAYGTTDLVLVLDAEGKIRFVDITSSEVAIEAAVDSAISD